MTSQRAELAAVDGFEGSAGAEVRRIVEVGEHDLSKRVEMATVSEVLEQVQLGAGRHEQGFQALELKLLAGGKIPFKGRKWLLLKHQEGGKSLSGSS